MIPAILLSGIVVTLVRATTVVTEGALGNGAFRGQLEGCPELCSTSGPASSDWERYKGNEELLACDKPMLLDFSLNKPVDDADAALFACSGTLTTQSVHSDRVEHCADSKTAVPVSVRTIWSGTPVGNVTSLCTAVQNVMSHVALKSSGSDCSSREAMSSFGYANGSFVGIYVGGRVHHQAAADMVQTLVDNVQTKGVQGDRYVAQICGADRTGAHTVGIVAVSSSDPGDLGALGFVQNSVRLWQNAICVSDFKTSSVSTSIDTITINEKPVRGGVPAAPNTEDAAFDDSLNAEETDRDEDQGSHLCKTEKVVAGDGCHSLAKECGISGAQFEKYNSYKPNLCGTLVPGQHVCCTKGKLPDFTPKPYKNGTCFTYNLQPGDSCSGLAASHSLTVTKIDKYNQHTWGWMGCKDALAYMNICLSPGKPPMPAPVTGTRCGPQKPGTKVPEDGGLNYLAKLNPCPLNACCDIWGQCGVTPEFCHKTQSKTGAPGTAKKGTNGCISHCGLDVVKGDAPATVRSVAYFEEYNMGRPCLNMDVRTLRGYAAYTHVHWAFGGITHDFTIDVSGAKDSFARFVSMPAPFQKVVSLGGWAFSTHPSTYNIFREAVKPANRHKFASNVAKFLQKHGLHGVDFDWEYPGEPDIPGIPAGNKDDGANYLAFLRELRQQMPATRSISVAAPASYWYLKHFPIAEISHVVDYIVYMTYDLHGQWDYGNKWASPGCKHGNCLRSHVNMTETHWALAMITKAGVPSAKVVAGVAAYGRSFQMTDPSCHGPHCTFTGPKSGATPGNCTRTAGYISNAELNDIRRGLHDGPNIKLNAIRTQNDNQQPIFNSPNMDKQGENDSLTSTDLHLQGSNTPWTTKSNMTGSETGTDNSASGGKVTEYFDSASQSNILLYDHDNWAAYMTPENLAARQETYRSLNLGGTALWALDLASFVLPYNSFDPTSEGIDPAHVDCTIPAVAHLTNKLTPKQRWQDTGAPAEWANAMVHWKKYRKKHGPNKGYQFSEWMGKRLKAPPGMHCESMSNDQTCTDNLQCIDAADFGPAKWAITNSMIGLHKSFSVPYNALHQVWETMNSAAGVVVNDFATVSTDDSLNLMLDFALLGFLLVAAPLFNVELEAVAGAEAIALATTKDTTLNLASMVVTIFKDSEDSPVSALTKQTDAQLTIMQMVNATWTLFERQNEFIFGGSDEAIDRLYELLSGGIFISEASATQESNVVQHFLRPYFALLIPRMWPLTGYSPFILNSGLQCSDLDDVEKVEGVGIDSDNAKPMHVCVDGKLYFLAGTYNSQDPQVCSGTGGDCGWVDFYEMAGTEYLGRGNSGFNGLTVADLVEASLNTYHANGNKNDIHYTRDIDEGTIADILHTGLRTPGVVRLPICGPDEAQGNWYLQYKGDGTSKNYPCD